MKFGNINHLEPSGSLQACNGTDLPLPFLHKHKQLFSERLIGLMHFVCIYYLFMIYDIFVNCSWVITRWQ